jgi:hypothetical protein
MAKSLWIPVGAKIPSGAVWPAAGKQANHNPKNNHATFLRVKMSKQAANFTGIDVV